MPPRKRPGEGDSEPLQDSIERLTEEVRVLRDALDDVRTDLQWAIQNGRMIIIPFPVAAAFPVDGGDAVGEDDPAPSEASQPSAPPGQLF